MQGTRRVSAGGVRMGEEVECEWVRRVRRWVSDEGRRGSVYAGAEIESKLGGRRGSVGVGAE